MCLRECGGPLQLPPSLFAGAITLARSYLRGGRTGVPRGRHTLFPKVQKPAARLPQNYKSFVKLKIIELLARFRKRTLIVGNSWVGEHKAKSTSFDLLSVSTRTYNLCHGQDVITVLHNNSITPVESVEVKAHDPHHIDSEICPLSGPKDVFTSGRGHTTAMCAFGVSQRDDDAEQADGSRPQSSRKRTDRGAASAYISKKNNPRACSPMLFRWSVWAIYSLHSVCAETMGPLHYKHNGRRWFTFCSQSRSPLNAVHLEWIILCHGAPS